MTIIEELQALSDPRKAAFFPRFFKTGPGEYGEGDIFIGVTVPNIRAVAKKHKKLSINEIDSLLASPLHEVRMVALLLLVEKCRKTVPKEVFDFYLARSRRINNWDLVDLSAPGIVGRYMLDNPRDILYKLARSPLLWDQRIAMVSTLTLIRAGELEDTYRLAEIYLTHRHDLMHKATGWMLREAGKRDIDSLRAFLDRHVQEMPRTMLRYAIEKFPEDERREYLST